MSKPHPGLHLKERRMAKGWTQEDLGFILGNKRAWVCRVERGRSGITPVAAKRLAEAFDTDAMYWLGRWNEYRLSRVKPRVLHETDEQRTARISANKPFGADRPY